MIHEESEGVNSFKKNSFKKYGFISGAQAEVGHQSLGTRDWALSKPEKGMEQEQTDNPLTSLPCIFIFAANFPL
ncbi:MAG: hypothetical protein D3916_15700 [Candidatus Electrothrix sp. MAN1_4]|nr:hypothetical protein [Candidatus Electrothrix sp. MAN1_4]